MTEEEFLTYTNYGDYRTVYLINKNGTDEYYSGKIIKDTFKHHSNFIIQNDQNNQIEYIVYQKVKAIV